MKKLSFLIISSFAYAETSEKTTTKVLYIAPKAINFDDVLVQGKLEKPEMAIITANEDDELGSLLRLRENFNDRLEQNLENPQEKK